MVLYKQRKSCCARRGEVREGGGGTIKSTCPYENMMTSRLSRKLNVRSSKKKKKKKKKKGV